MLPPEPAGPLALVAHDAGGAEILSSLLRRGVLGPQPDLRLVLDGPARAIFEGKLGPCQVMSLAQALDGAGTLLSGSGWQSTLECDALHGARAAGVPSIVFLDHWVNYRERFERDGRCELPDRFWVGDDDALAMARATWPDRPVELVANPYFADLREGLAARSAAAARSPGTGLRVLFVCEPVREPAQRLHGHPLHWGYTEESALAYVLQGLAGFGEPVAALVLRPHPSEAPDKYDALLAQSPWPVRRGGGHSLLDEVAASDLVIGCNSMALVVGLLGGKRVLCGIPPGGPACALPHRRIEMLRDLVLPRA